MPLQYIFHISDIHIRNGDEQISRYTEYSTVFANLHKSISQDITRHNLTSSDFIIIITGDIFHNKTVIGNYGLDLYKQLITLLTSLGRTIIFHGNHDKCQDIINQPSLISSTLNIPNLTILTHTQSFIIDDIGFSYVSIDDTLSTFKTSGRIENLPPFPIIDSTVKYKIALFHGTFANVKLYNGTLTTEQHKPYPFEWISSFDCALLGDIHLQQATLYKNTLWGYAGSLLQQNYGEDPINHGYLLWDIYKKDITSVDVYNPYGLINIKQEETIKIRHRGSFINLKNYLKQNTSFPNILEIKLLNNVDIPQLITILQEHNITSFNIINSKQQQAVSPSSLPINDISIDTNTLLEYFNKVLTPLQYTTLHNIITNNDNLLFNTLQYPQELHSECSRKNKELSTIIQSCITSTDTKPKRSFYIKYLEWENLYCYTNKNWIDFSDLANSTFLISGNNGTGKSAIYDILTLAIWGDITINKQNSLSKGIINTSSDKGYTIIDIELNNETYRIHRKFNTIKDRYVMNKSHSYIYKHIPPATLQTLKIDNACNQLITKLFGTLEDFLAASMVSQNMDMDLLSMSYKDCIAYIDKTTNIDYIYNLYNLFKCAINKYKDFKKTIETKKQVYESILSQPIQSIHTADMQELTSKLTSLQEQKEIFNKENNSILIDINDPINKTILSTDYDTLINNLGSIHIKSETSYANLKETYHELKVLFKTTAPDHSKYTKALSATLKSFKTIPTKPCTITFIQSEEAFLNAYQVPEESSSITELKEKQNTLNEAINSLNQNRPLQAFKPSTDMQTIITKINNLFPSLDAFQHHSINSQTSTPTNHKHTITYDRYQELQEYLTQLDNDHSEYTKSLQDIDRKLEAVYHRQQQLTHISIPSTPLPHMNSSVIKEELSKYNILQLQQSIQNDTPILESYYNEHNKIHQTEKELHQYKAEISLLQSQEEYQYNPNCAFCCRRPWVARINELNKIIESHTNQVKQFYDKLYNTPTDYLQLYIRHTQNTNNLIHCNTLNEWLSYYIYKEEQTSISTSLASLLQEKETINKALNIISLTKAETNNTITVFKEHSQYLFNLYKAHLSYNEYQNWKSEYDNCSSQLTNITEHIKYLEEIKPRIDNLNKLKHSYNEWLEYNDLYMTVKSHEYATIKEQLNQYEKYKEYMHQNNQKPLIERKINLSQQIKELDQTIEQINNTIASYQTHNIYNTTNTRNHNLLQSAYITVNNTIDVMNVIIEKFKLFRKDLYENTILNKLVEKTNTILKSLCHQDTKQFYLDFLLTETKDILHVNWLIKNNSSDSIISVNQASGFQRFAISLALRMALFSSWQYNQLFIDEGFTACDKLNLSIVPAFLKNLLKHFTSIIIVSHIDVIQDSIDNKIYITYNKNNKSSSIQYGNYAKAKTK